MYRCEQCNSVVGPRIPLQREVVERRVKRYPVREKANYVMKQSKRKKVWVDDAGGEGTEIVRELALCARCKSPHS